MKRTLTKSEFHDIIELKKGAIQQEGRVNMLKWILLTAMGSVFCVFALCLILGYVGTTAGVNLSIATAVILIGLFITFILVSNRERKHGDHRS